MIRMGKWLGGWMENSRKILSKVMEMNVHTAPMLAIFYKNGINTPLYRRQCVIQFCNDGFCQSSSAYASEYLHWQSSGQSLQFASSGSRVVIVSKLIVAYATNMQVNTCIQLFVVTVTHYSCNQYLYYNTTSYSYLYCNTSYHHHVTQYQ